MDSPRLHTSFLPDDRERDESSNALQDRNTDKRNWQRSLTSNNHDRYLTLILSKFNGVPDDLFNLQNWMHWVKGIDKKYNHDRRHNVLKSFADALMTQCIGENQKLIPTILENFSPEQKTRFHELVAQYKDNETAELFLKATKGSVSNGYSEDPEVEVGNLGSTTPTNIHRSAALLDLTLSFTETSVSRARLYDDPYDFKAEEESPKSSASNFYGRKRPQTYEEITTQKRKQNSPVGLRRVHDKKRNHNGAVKVKEGYTKLPIKRVCRQPNAISLANGNPAGNEVLNENREAYHDYVEDKTQVTVGDRRLSAETEVVYENSTPPCSPLDLGVNSEHVKRQSEPTQTQRNSDSSAATSVNENGKKVCSDMDGEICNTCRRFVPWSSTKCPHCVAVKTDYKPPRREEKENGSKPRTLFGSQSKLSSSTVENNDRHPSTSNTYQAQPKSYDEGFCDEGGTATFDDDNETPAADDKENSVPEYPASDEEIATKYPKPPSGPVLTLEMFEFIRSLLSPMDKKTDKTEEEKEKEKNLEKEKLVSGFGLDVLRSDLRPMEDRNWLIDLNLDFYLAMIRERSKTDGSPSVYIFYCYFFEMLVEQGYETVEETTGDDDIFSYDLVFIPCNISSQHWRLCVVRPAEKKFMMFDSMNRENSKIVDKIYEFLKLEKIRKRKINKAFDVDVSDIEEEFENPSYIDAHLDVSQVFNNNNNIALDSPSKNWTIYSNATPCIQTNAYDCGVFVAQYADYLSRKCEFDFGQSHGQYFRKRMIYETLKKNILTMPSST